MASPCLARPTWRHLGVVAIATLAWLASLAWVRPLMLPDEGRYVGVAWEMLRSGDWLTPTLNGLPYFHKPPLMYWLTAASMSFFGPHVAAARAAPLLGATLGALAMYGFVCRWWGERTAKRVLVLLLLQPLFFVAAQFANLDMLVAGCITATVLLLAHAALSLEMGNPARKALWAAYGMAALGVLAKGLIGAALPALVIGVWLLLRRRWRLLLALWSWPGVVLFFALAGPWFLAMQQRHSGFLNYFFVVQQLDRFTVGGFNNAHPWWFFSALLALVTLPWLPWLKPVFRPSFFANPTCGPQRQLMAVWIVVIVGFFSIPNSKLVGYVLPVVPPLACLLADVFSAAMVLKRPWVRRAGWASVGVSLSVGWGVVLALAAHPTRSTHELATLLNLQRGTDEPVWMLNDYYFDVPVIAKLKHPARVVDEWSDSSVAQEDNWRKELADAAVFNPAIAAKVLVNQSNWHRALCEAPVNWVLATASAAQDDPVLRHAHAVATVRHTTLWKVERASPDVSASLGCANDTSPSGLSP
jgi:4-amino-4-deoxy-L-arabinose transferase-like glycosyltransferase